MYIIRYIISCFLIIWFVGISAFGAAPDFSTVKSNLDSETFSLSIDEGSTLKDNINELFSPTSSNSVIWDVLTTIGVGLFVLFMMWTGFLFINNADNEGELKKAKMNIVYLIYGALLFFGANWIIRSGIKFGTISQSTVASNLTDGLFFQLLSFFKAGAFFLAIVQIIYFGFKIIRAFEKDDKIKEARKGIMNVIISLFLIKIIDYIFYIGQKSEFKSDLTSLIVTVSKVFAFILGILLVIIILYGGIQLVLSTGKEDNLKKGFTILKNVFLIVVVVLLFLLISYQIVQEFNI